MRRLVFVFVQVHEIKLSESVKKEKDKISD